MIKNITSRLAIMLASPPFRVANDSFGGGFSHEGLLWRWGFKCVLFLLLSLNLHAQSEVSTDDKALIINESTINGTNFEFSPTFYENGIVFISTDKSTADKITDKKQKGNKGVSIQIARRGPEGVLATPEVFSKKITSAYNDGPMCFDRENNVMFYSTNNVKDGKKIKSKKGEVRQKIVMVTKQGEDWSAPVDLPFNNEEYDNVHPALSVDGNTLFFSSNRPNGIGGMDLYLVRKNGDTWGSPVNLGPDVNTEKNDVFPFIHPEGTLYYASEGKGGLGGLDVFLTKPNSEGTFSSPKNIGKPYNSEADDFGFIADLEGKNGYFSSNRQGGKGEDDIYSFHTDNIIGKDKMKNDCKIMTYIVEKMDGKDIEGVSIKVINISDYEIGEILTDNNGNIIKLMSSDSTNILTSVSDGGTATYSSNSEGKVELKLKEGKYLANISKNGYQNKQILLPTCQDRDEVLVLLEKLGDNTIPMTGTLKGNRGNPITNAVVTLTDEKTGQTQVIQTDNEGKFKYFVKPNTEYKLSATKDNFLATSTKFSTTGMQKDAPEIPIKIEMAELTSPVEVGKVFQLNNVYYNYNDATLRPDARLDLDPLVGMLKSFPEMEIELSSHTDARGNNNYNQTLSQRRAESCFKYLTDRGISPARIKVVGYGETQLRNNCADGTQCTENEHKINRRTEVKITKAPADMDVNVADKYYNGSSNQSNNNSGSGNILASDNNGNSNTTTYNPPSNTTKPSSSDLNSSITNNIPNGEYWVIAGSYQDAKNAEEQAQSLSRKGYVPTVVFASEINFYRLLVAKTSSLSEARRLLKELKSKREPAFVLRG